MQKNIHGKKIDYTGNILEWENTGLFNPFETMIISLQVK